MGNINAVGCSKAARKWYLAAFFAFVAIACCACLALPSNCAHADTLASVNGKRVVEVKGKLVKKKGATFYKYKKLVSPDAGDGATVGKTRTARNAFLTLGKKSYYFTSSGKAAKGWTKVKSDYYYFDRATGVQVKGKKGRKAKVDGIKIKKDGKAVKTTYGVNKIKTMMKAREIMLANTKYSDSKATKRYKVFKWVMSGNYRQFRTLKSTGHRRGWELVFASDMFDRGKWGCCVSNACAFAYLAKECGYKDVNICDDTGHAFVVINGRFFDTLFAEVNGFNNYYNAPHSRAVKDGVFNSLKI